MVPTRGLRKGRAGALGSAETAERLPERTVVTGLNPAGVSGWFPAGAERGEAEKALDEPDGAAEEIFEHQVTRTETHTDRHGRIGLLGCFTLVNTSVELAPPLVDSARIPPTSHERTSQPGSGVNQHCCVSTVW
jgi:hypothetical protein